MSFSPEERKRYARHFSLPGFGTEGQQRLKESSVLCIGAGGLGSPITMYLAAAGVGHVGVVDADTVDVSNLQRQLLFGSGNVGEKKVHAAAERLRDINPAILISTHDTIFRADNAMALAGEFNLLIDGTDNFPTRYLSNDVAVFLGIPNVYGSIFRFEGQVAVFAPHLGGPCYRCLFPNPPDPGSVPNCAEGGVLGVLPGVVGSLQAMEAIKLLAGIGESSTGRLLHYDALALKFREFKLRRDPLCPVCGDSPTITEPIDYEEFCGMPAIPNPIPDVPAIDVHELKAKLDRGDAFQFIDVREKEENDFCKIEGAKLIPLGEFMERLGEIEKDRPVVVHCKVGGRSARAVEILIAHGFDATNVEGGINAWSEEIDESVPLY
ncbi:MAG: molybdopterin-synthase adenylyltransferase MoeB [Verrucomicrobiota bacterium]